MFVLMLLTNNESLQVEINILSKCQHPSWMWLGVGALQRCCKKHTFSFKIVFDSDCIFGSEQYVKAS